MREYQLKYDDIYVYGEIHEYTYMTIIFMCQFVHYYNKSNI